MVSAGKKRDLDRTRRRILDAAAREFAEKGLAGARIDAIAERAKVNKAMIYYVHGSKDDLHLAVIRDLFEEKIIQIDSRVADVSLSVDDLLSVFDLYFDAFFDRQDYVRIMINDAVTGGAALRRLRKERPELFEIFDTLSNVFQKSVAEGNIRPVDSDKSVVMIVFILSSLVCMLPHMDIVRPRQSAAYKELRDMDKWKAFLKAAFKRIILPAD
jgi:AcrR family transcriptional regulator